MLTQNVSIPLDADVAKLYLGASDQDKLRMQWLLNLWLKRAIYSPTQRSLEEIMDDAGRLAEESGLSEEMLKEILNERP